MTLVRDLYRLNGQKGGIPRIVVTVLGAALASAALLAALAIPQVLDKEDRRVESRTPLLSAGAGVARDMRLSPGGVVVEVIRQPLAGTQLTRVLVSAGPNSSMVPPGLPRLPQPDEAFVSPEFARLMTAGATDVILEDLHMAGHIAPEGLRQPSELLVYQGVRLGEMSDPRRVESFGFADPLLEGGNARYVGHILALFVVLPSVVLFALSGRSFARGREEQLRALRLMGAPPIAMRGLAAGDVGALAMLGAGLGAATFARLRGAVTRLPLVDHSVFPSDSRLNLAPYLVVLAGIPLAAATVALLTTGRAARPVVGLRGVIVPVQSRPWTVAPFAFSSATLVAMVLYPGYQLGGAAELILWTGAGIGILVGLPLGMATLIRLLAAGVGRSPSVAVMLAMKQLSFRPSGMAHLSGALGACLFITGVGAVYAGFLSPPTPPDRLPNGMVVVSVVGNAGGTLPADFSADSLSPTAALLPIIPLDRPNGEESGLTAVVADCGQIGLLLGPEVACPKGAVIVGPDESEQYADAVGQRFQFEAGGLRQIEVQPQPLVSRAAYAAQLDGRVALPRSVLGTDSAGLSVAGSSYLAVLSDTSEIQSLRDRLITLAPSVLVTYPTDFASVAEETDAASRFLILCLIVSTSLFVVAFLAASFDVVFAARQFGLGLRVTSPPRGLLMRSHMWLAAAPTLLATIMGVGTAVLAGNVLAATRSIALPWSAFLGLAIAGALCSLLVAIATAPAIVRADSSLRRE